MNRTVVLALSALVLLGACSDHKPANVAAGSSPELLRAQPAPPAVEVSPVALPPLPSATAGDATATAAPAQQTVAATAIDSPATDPKGTLTKAEEVNSMPMAAHGNNHSSPSLETRPSTPPK